MRKIIFMLLGMALSFVLILSSAFSADTKTLQIRKQPEIQQVKPKKPVKIRMKRSADGKYTWDLTGDDVDEIVKVDKRLKKLLNIE